MISCNSAQKEKHFNNFPEEIDLKAKLVKSKEIKIPRNIVGIKDSIIIVNNYRDDHLIYLINKNDLSITKVSQLNKVLNNRKK